MRNFGRDFRVRNLGKKLKMNQTPIYSAKNPPREARGGFE